MNASDGMEIDYTSNEGRRKDKDGDTSMPDADAPPLGGNSVSGVNNGDSTGIHIIEGEGETPHVSINSRDHQWTPFVQNHQSTTYAPHFGNLRSVLGETEGDMEVEREGGEVTGVGEDGSIGGGRPRADRSASGGLFGLDVGMLPSGRAGWRRGGGLNRQHALVRDILISVAEFVDSI
jgi:hypothetical protein